VWSVVEKHLESHHIIVSCDHDIFD